MITEIKERIEFLKYVAKDYSGMCDDDISFMIMAQTHIRHRKYDFDKVVLSHKSNSIYLYKNGEEIKRISDHYSPYGLMNDDYFDKQGVIIVVPKNLIKRDKNEGGYKNLKIESNVAGL